MVVDKNLKSRLSHPKPTARPPESRHHSTIIRARRSVEDGQYKKALQSLTSAGLAQPSDEVLGEMLAKPTLPADPMSTDILVSMD